MFIPTGARGIWAAHHPPHGIPCLTGRLHRLSCATQIQCASHRSLRRESAPAALCPEASTSNYPRRIPSSDGFGSQFPKCYYLFADGDHIVSLPFTSASLCQACQGEIASPNASNSRRPAIVKDQTRLQILWGECITLPAPHAPNSTMLRRERIWGMPHAGTASCR
jgi:hypothetical protein